MESLRYLVSLVIYLACVAATTAQAAPVPDESTGAPAVTAVTADFAEDSARVDNFYLRNHTLRTLQRVPSLVTCGEKCATLGGCRSLNYRRGTGVCELNAATRTDFPGDLVEGNGGEDVVYLGRASAIIVKIKQSAICPCCDNECQHDAYCVPGDEATTEYKCVCSSDWAGDYCENAIAKWSEWSNWSPCSESCGPGEHTRWRECAGLVHTPDSCLGESVEFRGCWNQAPCAEWAAWRDTGPCSASVGCGYGTVNRARTCRGNRTDCPGADSQTSARCGPSVSCEAPWRLVGGSRPGEGRLEVFSTVLGLWGTVCTDGWHRWDTDVACRTLGLQPPPAYLEHGYENLCDNGWWYHEGSCYWGGSPQSNVNFVQAEEICRLSGAYLASILTSDENTFVRNTFSNPSKIWLGAHNDDQDNGGYLTSLRWTDGSFPGYQESVLKDAVPKADKHRCLSMENASGEWAVKPCTEAKGVVCKKYPDFSLEFGPGEGAIHLTRMDCHGCEDHLSQCRHASWHDVTSCSHSQDVGLKCSVVCPTYETSANTATRFPFKPLDSASLLLKFTVQAAGTIKLTLSGGESLAEAVYTIALSATSPSYIYHHASATYNDMKVVEGLLDENAQRGFWVAKTSDDVILVGRQTDEAEPLLEWADDQSSGVSPALYVGFASLQPTKWQFSSFCG